MFSSNAARPMNEPLFSRLSQRYVKIRTISKNHEEIYYRRYIVDANGTVNFDIFEISIF